MDRPGTRAGCSRETVGGLACLWLLACGGVPVAEDTAEGAAPASVVTPAREGSIPVDAVPEIQGRSWYVSLTGRDDAAGTSDAPLRTLARAVQLVRPGEAIRVLSGVYAEEFILDSRGEGAAVIIVRGEGSPLPTFAPANKSRSTVVRVQGRWSLQNLRVDVGNAAMAAVSFESGSSGSSLVGSELRSGTSSAGVVVDGPQGLLIQGNTIHHFIRPDTDSHGVVVVGPSRDITLRDNDIHHNSGDSIQCQAGAGPAVGLLIEHNTLHDDGENGVDVKQCQNVTIRGNTISSLPNTAIRAPGSSAGEAVVIHLSARGVTVQDNTISLAGRGVSVLQDADPPENIRVEGNHLQNIRDLPVGNGFGIRVEGGRGVVVVGNSVEDSAGYALMLAADGKDITGLEVRGNTLRGGASAPLVRLGAERFRPGLVFQGNSYSLNGVLKADGVLDKLQGSFAGYREDFPGERLTLSTPEKLQVWRQVTGVDSGTSLLQ